MRWVAAARLRALVTGARTVRAEPGRACRIESPPPATLILPDQGVFDRLLDVLDGLLGRPGADVGLDVQLRSVDLPGALGVAREAGQRVVLRHRFDEELDALGLLAGSGLQVLGGRRPGGGDVE